MDKDILSRIEKTKSCWNWKGGHISEGYGTYKHKLAHRLVYEFFKGKIQKGLELDHLCRNRNCVNPKHLEAVSHRENVIRGTCPTALNAKKTHCPQGHLLSGENVYNYFWAKKKIQSRLCKICRKLSQKELWNKAPWSRTKKESY